MFFRRLIFILFSAICLLLPTNVSAAVDVLRTKDGIGHTDERPQWKDVGMCDVLAITGGSTLTPPTTVRVVHETPSGTAPSVQVAQTRQYSIQRLSTYNHHHTSRGYIYLISCLRL